MSQLIFTPSKSNFVSFKEEKEREKAREKGDDDKFKDGSKTVPKDAEGGLEVCVGLVDTCVCLSVC
jgi:hypothetical protein